MRAWKLEQLAGQWCLHGGPKSMVQLGFAPDGKLEVAWEDSSWGPVYEHLPLELVVELIARLGSEDAVSVILRAAQIEQEELESAIAQLNGEIEDLRATLQCLCYLDGVEDAWKLRPIKNIEAILKERAPWVFQFAKDIRTCSQCGLACEHHAPDECDHCGGSLEPYYKKDL